LLSDLLAGDNGRVTIASLMRWTVRNGETMTDAELKQFYEKLYYLELEAREKIQGRLQLALTLMLAIFGAVAFLFQNFDYQAGAWTAMRISFLFFFCFGSVLLVVGMVHFSRAFFDNRYYLRESQGSSCECFGRVHHRLLHRVRGLQHQNQRPKGRLHAWTRVN
jgi:hypothetical protein